MPRYRASNAVALGSTIFVMKNRNGNPHPGPFRIPPVDVEFAGILVAIGFVVMGLVALPIAKWFLLCALALGVGVAVLLRILRKE